MAAYVYSKSYYFKVASTYGARFDPQTNCFSIYLLYKATTFRKIHNIAFQRSVNTLQKLLFKRLTYTGKGYRVYLKNKNRIFMQLGYSHKVYVSTSNIAYVFLMKTKFLFLSFCHFSLDRYMQEITLLRSLNIFTSKGIRLSRQVVYKKVGKVSAYR